jgi:ribosome-binding factor A
MHRREKMAAQIKKALSDIISHDLKDPRVAGHVTISRVEVSADVSIAKIYFSILAEAEARQEIMQALNKAKGFFRSELARDMTIRHVPLLEFKLDYSIERGMRVMSLLNNLDRPRGEEGRDEVPHE